MPAAMLLLDPERLVVRFANPASVRLLGDPFRGGAVAGRRLDELLPRASALGVLDVLRGVAATGEPHEESELRIDGLPAAPRGGGGRRCAWARSSCSRSPMRRSR